MSLTQQLANIGSEVGRVRAWYERDEKILSNAARRTFELFDLTIADPRWRGRGREIVRAREVFSDAILGGLEYGISLAEVERYFLAFAIASRRATF